MSRNRAEVLQELKLQLIERRDAIRKALAGDLTALQALNAGGGDSVDFASDSQTTELNSQLAEVETRELKQIETALQRMEDGTYGICDVTGKEIPLARLEALPYATTCVEAQRKLEHRRGRAGYVPDWSRMIDGGGSAADDVSIGDIELG